MAPEFDRGPAFEPRPVRARGVLGAHGYRLKVYDITLPGEELDGLAFERGAELGASVLPRPAVAGRRPGVGFLVRHQGLDAGGGRVLYLALCWWDNANELFVETFILGEATGRKWIRARAEGSFCVWDLEVMWHERGAYVRHVLGAGGVDLEAYLRDVIEIRA